MPCKQQLGILTDRRSLVHLWAQHVGNPQYPKTRVHAKKEEQFNLLSRRLRVSCDGGIPHSAHRNEQKRRRPRYEGIIWTEAAIHGIATSI